MTTATVELSEATEHARESIDLHDVHVVLRGGWEAGDIVRERGEVLVTAGWRNYKALVNHRYLIAPDYSLLESLIVCGCGRMWDSELRMSEHDCPAR